MTLIRYGGGTLAAVLFLGCGGPSPADSPTVGQSTGTSPEGYSSLAGGLAGYGIPAFPSPSLPQPANLERPASQSGMTEPPQAGQPAGACFAIALCLHLTGSTTAGLPSAEYSQAPYTPQETGPQAVALSTGPFPIDDPPEEVTPVANPVIDHAEEMQAHDLWQDQILQELE